MKRFYKTIFCAVFISAVFFLAVFAAEKIFSDKLYIAKDFILTFFNGNTANYIAEIEDNEDYYEKVDIAKLIENGAVLNDSLMLINSEHPLSEDYRPVLIDLNGNEVFANPYAAKAYDEIKKAIKKEFGNSLYIMSSYRTPEEQSAAIESEGEYAAGANESEHLTGLALDVYVKYHAGMGFLDSEEGKFVNSYCQNYGFIIRYPYYGESVTGIPFEPWHIRYVGQPHAKIITENRITFEEYIDSFVPETHYIYEEYYISRQSGKRSFSIPKGITDIVISPDNTGYYIITGKIN